MFKTIYFWAQQNLGDTGPECPPLLRAYLCHGSLESASSSISGWVSRYEKNKNLIDSNIFVAVRAEIVIAVFAL